MAKDRKQQRKGRRADYMSIAEARAFLDRWAAQQNEWHVARQNLLNLVADLRDYIEDEGLNADQLDANEIKQLMAQMVTDAAKRQRTRIGDPRRGRHDVSDEQILEAVAAWRSYRLSDSDIARRVAKQKFRNRKGKDVTVSRSRIMACIKEDRDKKQPSREDQ